MNLVTFAQAKDSRLRDIANVCPSSDDFKSLVNDATRMLMRRGNFWGTVQKVQICTYNGCITWPRFVGTVLATNVCKHPVPIWNNWFAFEPIGPHDFMSGAFSFSNGSCHGNVFTENDGVVAVFNQIPCGSPHAIRVFPSVRADIGKQITIYGIDSNGQTVRTKVNGVWQDGVTVTLAIPFVDTPILFQSVTRISKPLTQGVVRYYQVDAANNVLLDLVSHDPSETEPVYRHSRIAGLRSGCNNQCNTDSACNGIRSITALIKLEFQPVVLDSDLIYIENLDAVKDMVMSIREKEAGHFQQAVALEASAIHELNLQLRDKFPNTQIPVNVMPYGTARLTRQGIGTLI